MNEIEDADRPYLKLIWNRQGNIDVAEMQWFDEPDYSIALSEKFYTGREAYAAASIIAAHHDVKSDVKWVDENFDEWWAERA